MRTLDWWMGDPDGIDLPFLGVVLRCGRMSGILGSQACVAMFHDVVEQGVEGGVVGEEFPIMSDRYEVAPGEAHRLLSEIDSLRRRLEYIGVSGAAVLGRKREPIEFIPGCGKPWMFYNQERTIRVGVDSHGLLSLDERTPGFQREGRSKTWIRGDWLFDVWMDGPWGPDICLFGGIPGFPGANSDLEPCFVQHATISAASVFGGMLDLLSIMARESQRTGEHIEKEM